MRFCLVCFLLCFFFFSSRRRHTRCALVTGVQTCTLPISEMRTLFANLPEADKAAVVEALQAANFDPAVDSLTGSVQVPAGDYHKEIGRASCRERVCQYV